MVALFLEEDTLMRLFAHIRVNAPLRVEDRVEIEAAIRHATLDCACGKEAADGGR